MYIRIYKWSFKDAIKGNIYSSVYTIINSIGILRISEEELSSYKIYIRTAMFKKTIICFLNVTFDIKNKCENKCFLPFQRGPQFHHY